MEFKHFQPVKEKGLIPVFETLAADAGKSLGNAKVFLTPSPSNASGFLRKKPQFDSAQPQTMPVLGYNTLGFPVFSNLVISGSNYRDDSGNVIGEFSDIRLDVVLMEISNENNLITADIQGRDGTIVEYSSSKSWMINVNGRILAKTPGVYPVDDVKNLITALSSNRPLRVTSWYLQMAKIYNIVIKSKNFPQEIGSQEYQKFEFTAIADTPLVLRLNAAGNSLASNNNGPTS